MIVAGVDGGATKTRAVLVDERGHVLGTGEGGPSNYDNIGIDAASMHLHDALWSAFAAAGVATKRVDAIMLGMAGVVSRADRKRIADAVSAFDMVPDGGILVDHDIRIALAGGLGGREGVVLIAGTGSSSYGRRDDGRTHRTGWGYLMDDAGSAYWLGLRALIATVRAWDGRGSRTILEDSVRRHLGFSDIDDIMHIVYHDRPDVSHIAGLAPLVVTAAERGDAVADNILKAGAHELARMIAAVATALEFREFAVTMTGGMMESVPAYRDRVSSSLRTMMPDALVRDPLLPPLLGAALLALGHAGVDMSDTLLQSLRQQSLTQPVTTQVP